MLTSLLNIFFGCGHHKTTFPFTPVGTSTYVACLDCGKEFGYNWKEMRMGSPRERFAASPGTLLTADSQPCKAPVKPAWYRAATAREPVVPRN
jgi:hypothetical protein